MCLCSVHLIGCRISLQLKCCGVNNYEDFKEAEEFKKYKPNQVVPEACCFLKNYTQTDGVNLFTPKHDACINNPTSSNSYFNKV